MQAHTWTVRVTSAAEAATVLARQHRFEVGDPLSFDEQYPRVSALEHVLGALGADLVNGLRVVARKRRVAIEHVEATVQAELNNPLTYLAVVGEQGHPGLERVLIKVYISSLGSEQQLHEVWQETLARSPLVRTFQAAIRLEMNWKLVL